MPEGGVAFYNCGEHSGRSQPHKHLQARWLLDKGPQDTNSKRGRRIAGTATSRPSHAQRLHSRLQHAQLQHGGEAVGPRPHAHRAASYRAPTGQSRAHSEAAAPAAVVHTLAITPAHHRWYRCPLSRASPRRRRWRLWWTRRWRGRRHWRRSSCGRCLSAPMPRALTTGCQLSEGATARGTHSTGPVLRLFAA